jgi:hypothetical protein
MVFSGVWSRVYDEEFVALAMWDYCFMKAMGNDVGEILLVGASVGFTECFFPGMCNCAELENLSPGESQSAICWFVMCLALYITSLCWLEWTFGIKNNSANVAILLFYYSIENSFCCGKCGAWKAVSSWGQMP